MEDYNAHYFKELRTRNENMPFLHQEEAFLASRGACSRTLKGIFRNLEWPPLYLRTMKIAYKHTLLNPPKQPCLIHQSNPASSTTPLCNVHTSCLYHHKPISLRPRNHDYSPPTPISFAHDPTLHRLQAHPVSSTEPMVFRPRPHPAPSTSSFCIIRCPMVFRPPTHSALSPNPSYIASAPTFSTRSPKAFFFTTQKKKKQKTTVFYFFFFNLYFSSYTPYA